MTRLSRDAILARSMRVAAGHRLGMSEWSEVLQTTEAELYRGAIRIAHMASVRRRAYRTGARMRDACGPEWYRVCVAAITFFAGSTVKGSPVCGLGS